MKIWKVGRPRHRHGRGQRLGSGGGVERINKQLMEKIGPKLFKSRAIEINSDKKNIADIEDEVLARIEEIRAGDCVIGEGKTAKVYICEKDPWSCYKIINSAYYPRLKVDQEMKFMDEAIKLGIRVPLPIFSMMDGNVESLAMERVNGQSIKEIVEDDLGLPENFDLNNFFAELNDFLRILHMNRIYHRDLHEGNIMIDDKGKPWIIDFGDAVRAFSEEEAYVSHFMNPKTKRLENMRYTSDENNLAKIRSDLRSYFMGRKANT